ncbi:universal stress family protein [Natrinema caseinilyticum]|uniref:universal stress family protein n=1 Tax=Natrinema caseinilyticum TaxID=2961570 RepID=UPI0020C4CDC5|nr:universal stress family protein [Natrinema caseinilyticum]
MRTLDHAIARADQFDDAQLVIVHVNLLHTGKEEIDRTQLRCALDEEVGLPDNTNCYVRDAYLIEKAILGEADLQNADYVIIGESTQSRWRQLLAARFDIGTDLESALSHQLDGDLIVV